MTHTLKNIQFKCILTALIQDGNDPDSQKEANVSLALSIDLLRVSLLSLGLFLTMFQQLGKLVRIMRGERGIVHVVLDLIGLLDLLPQLLDLVDKFDFALAIFFLGS